VRKGVEEVYAAYCEHKTTAQEFLSSSFIRLKKIRELQEEGKLDGTLAWRNGHGQVNGNKRTAA
jgi:hypothetical protein